VTTASRPTRQPPSKPAAPAWPTSDPRSELEADWLLWLASLFGPYITALPAAHHQQLWEWVWSLKPGIRPAAFVAIWPRGGAKSTSAELATVAIGARRARRYGLYVCETQDQSDDHVANIGDMLESREVAAIYPSLADRAVGKFGNSKGWRRNRLRTAAGFTIDALGLDTGARGVKLEDARPDLLILDDLDGEHDTPATTERKIKTITRKLIPAGSRDLATLAIQNLVHPDSIFARLADGRADFLSGRVISGPIPALQGLTVDQHDGRYLITAGQPTWSGQDVEACQAMIDDMGITAFRSECQHEVTPEGGGMFDHLVYRHCTWDDLPDLVRVAVWVDPAVSSTDQSDSMGIQADGLAPDGKVYRLWSWEQITTPLDALCRAIRKAVELGADTVGVETDQGGDAWRSVYREAVTTLQQQGVFDGHRPPEFRHAKAGAIGPKKERAGQMLAAYERDQFVHVLGTHDVLEAALWRFPLSKPLDLVDAAFWSWRDLVPARQRARMRFVS
jgi:hypothetical protein